MKLAALVVPLLAATFACGTVETDGGPDVLGATPAGEYVVTGVTDGGAPRAVVKGSEIRFTFDDGRLGIRAGCNGMGGEYSLDGSRLTVRGIGGTDMGCSQPLMDQDAWVAGLFDDPVQLTLGKDAVIVAGDVVLSMSPREEVHPDKPLTGTRWKLDGTFDATTASSTGLAVLRIADDGRSATIDERCRRTTVVTKVDGDLITWSDARTDEHSCPKADEPGLDADVRDAVMRLLAGAATVKIQEDALTLTFASGEGGLTFRALTPPSAG